MLSRDLTSTPERKPPGRKREHPSDSKFSRVLLTQDQKHNLKIYCVVNKTTEQEVLYNYLIQANIIQEETKC